MITKFEHWEKWFFDNGGNQPDMHWDENHPLLPEEKAAIAASVAMFQRGESSDGKESLSIADKFL